MLDFLTVGACPVKENIYFAGSYDRQADILLPINRAAVSCRLQQFYVANASQCACALCNGDEIEINANSFES